MTPSPQPNRPKAAKDAPVFTRSPVRGEVNFAPFECTERPSQLTKDERLELRDQHRYFKIFPSGGDQGLIADFVRRVPYNSEKKSFYSKTGREVFERKSITRAV